MPLLTRPRAWHRDESLQPGPLRDRSLLNALLLKVGELAYCSAVIQISEDMHRIASKNGSSEQAYRCYVDNLKASAGEVNQAGRNAQQAKQPHNAQIPWPENHYVPIPVLILFLRDSQHPFFSDAGPAVVLDCPKTTDERTSEVHDSRAAHAQNNGQYNHDNRYDNCSTHL